MVMLLSYMGVIYVHGKYLVADGIGGRILRVPSTAQTTILKNMK